MAKAHQPAAVTRSSSLPGFVIDAARPPRRKPSTSTSGGFGRDPIALRVPKLKKSPPPEPSASDQSRRSLLMAEQRLLPLTDGIAVR